MAFFFNPDNIQTMKLKSSMKPKSSLEKKLLDNNETKNTILNKIKDGFIKESGGYAFMDD